MNELNEVDLTGLKCPMPIVRLSKMMKQLNEGETVTAVADDPAFCLDVESWCEKTGHALEQLNKTEERLVAIIRCCNDESD